MTEKRLSGFAEDEVSKQTGQEIEGAPKQKQKAHTDSIMVCIRAVPSFFQDNEQRYRKPNSRIRRKWRRDGARSAISAVR